MVVNSLKPLEEIRQGRMLSAAAALDHRAWLSAWSTAQIGVSPTGLKPYFLNSILMVVPAVALSDAARRAQRLRADQMALPRRQHRVRPDAARLLHPVPDRAHPVGPHPRRARPCRHGPRPRPHPRDLRPRLHHALLPQLLRGLPDRAGARRRRSTAPASSRSSAASCCPSSGPIIVVAIIWQFTNIWNDFLFGASFADFESIPMTVALQQPRQLVDGREGIQRAFRRRDPGGPAHARRLRRLRTLFRARPDGRLGQGISPCRFLADQQSRKVVLARRRSCKARRHRWRSRRAASSCSSARPAAASPRS